MNLIAEELRLTAQLLRKAADRLHGGNAYDGETYMCCAVCFQADSLRSEFIDLINEAGIPSTSGCLFSAEGVPVVRGYYDLHAQPVRFMFLEFLALMLESEAAK